MKKGYVTVFFTMVLGVALLFLVGLVYGVRENAIRMKAQCSVDTAMTSFFGEYHKELWKQYGLVFVDSSYKTDQASMALCEKHLQECLNQNFDETRLSLLGGKDLLSLNCKDVTIDRVLLATDLQGASIRSQIYDYMSYQDYIGYAKRIQEYAKEITLYHLLDGHSYEDAQNAKDELNRMAETDYGLWVPTSETALDVEESYESAGFLLNRITNANELSDKRVNLDSLAGHRTLNVGVTSNPGKETILNDYFFREYLAEVTGNYEKSKEGSVLSYETEYLIIGKESDLKNLAGVAKRILLIREAANYKTLSEDEGKERLIEIVSAAIAILIECPDAKGAIEVILKAIWSYVESISDMKVIMKGGKIPLIKDPCEWRTDLDSAIRGETIFSNSSEGMSYKDYLHAFLFLTEESKLMNRFYDVVEMDIRNTYGNENFRLDLCVDQIEAVFVLQSDFGYSYQMTREKQVKH